MIDHSILLTINGFSSRSRRKLEIPERGNSWKLGNSLVIHDLKGYWVFGITGGRVRFEGGGTGTKKIFLQKRVPRTLKRRKKLFSAKKIFFKKMGFFHRGMGGRGCVPRERGTGMNIFFFKNVFSVR